MIAADVILFDDKGQFVPPSDDVLAALEAADVARIEEIASAWTAQVGAEATLQEAEDRVTTVVSQLREVEGYLHEHYARQTHMDLLRQNGMNREVKA